MGLDLQSTTQRNTQSRHKVKKHIKTQLQTQPRHKSKTRSGHNQDTVKTSWVTQHDISQEPTRHDQDTTKTKMIHRHDQNTSQRDESKTRSRHNPTTDQDDIDYEARHKQIDIKNETRHCQDITSYRARQKARHNQDTIGAHSRHHGLQSTTQSKTQ